MKKFEKQLEGIPLEKLEVLHIEEGDTLAIETKAMLSQEFIERKEKEFSERLGCKVAIFDVCFRPAKVLHQEKDSGEA